jgi:hypothetical protein
MTWSRHICALVCAIAGILYSTESVRAQDRTQPPEHSIPTGPDRASEAAATPPGADNPPLFVPDKDLDLPSSGELFLADPEAQFSRGGGGFIGGPFDSIPGLGRGSLAPRAGYNATWFPIQPVIGQNTYFGYVQQNASVSVPVWRDGPDGISLSAHVRNGLYQTNAILPQSGLPFPATLWNIGIGANGQYQFDNGWTGALGIQFGSASDEPFANLQVINIGFNAALRIPWRESFTWNFSLSYSPTSELTFPVPGVSLTYQPSPNFRANIGLPFAIMWRPTEDLTIDASYMLLTTVRAKISYRVWDQVRIYVDYSQSNDGYYLADNPGMRNRVLYHDSRVTGGVQIRLAKWANLDVSGGYGFNRYFSEGSQTGAFAGNQLTISPGPFAAAALQIRW